MAKLKTSLATLRIYGDDLIPSEVTSLLGVDASFEQVKGQVFIGKKTGQRTIAKIGMWKMYAEDREPGNLDEQISEIFNKLPKDQNIWKSLSNKYDIDLFCGLFMEESNEVITISSSSMKLLAERGVELILDLYGQISENFGE
jgi:hypothetical protein